MTDIQSAASENAQREDSRPGITHPDSQPKDAQTDEDAGKPADKAADEPLKALRTVIVSCLVFFFVFVLALPKLREVSEEEQIIPDLVTWSALESVVRREEALNARELGTPDWTNFIKALNPPGWERDVAKTASGQACYKPWIRENSGIGPELVHESECPVLLRGVYIPGHGIGHLLLLYSRGAPDGSPVERIFFPYFFVFPGATPDERTILELPTQNYVIVKLRLPPGAPGKFPFFVVPRAAALDLLKVKMNGAVPRVLPGVAPANFALVERVLWRAGKPDLLSPQMTDAQLRELDKWLSERLKNPPQISVFGVSMDVTLASSLLGVILALFAFAMVGPLQDLQGMHSSGHGLSWTMTTRTMAYRYGFVLEFLACLFSFAFAVAPIVFVSLQIGYGILKPLGSTADLLTAILNSVAGIAAAIIFAIAGLELRYRRRHMF